MEAEEFQTELRTDLEAKLRLIRDVVVSHINNPAESKRLLIGIYESAGSSLDNRLIGEAIDLGIIAHEGQTRDSGETYVSHSFQVGYILAYTGVGTLTVTAGVLHDAVEDNYGPKRAEIIERVYNSLGWEVLKLVIKVTNNHNDILRKINNSVFRNLLLNAISIVDLKTHTKASAIKMADTITNLLTLDGLRSFPYITAEERKKRSIKSARLYGLPAAQIVDNTYTPLSGLKFAPYMEYLLAKEEARLGLRTS